MYFYYVNPSIACHSYSSLPVQSTHSICNVWHVQCLTSARSDFDLTHDRCLSAQSGATQFVVRVHDLVPRFCEPRYPV